MSYTHPFGQPQGIPREFTNKMREILIAELIAINGYQSHIAASSIQELNDVWHNIMLDEKEHYGWILKLLRKYDPEQYKQYKLFQNANPVPQTPIKMKSGPVDSQVILNYIRDDIKGELEAVILYEEELPEFRYADIRTTLKDIIDEEKGHAEHLTQILLKYDPDAYDELT